ncbi:MAG TPA: DUF4386 domain-containing protein [Ktedonobacterales bacterium]|nr:DUF4386 domain-containing protein [Ktedonobacterales bacterium]
MNQAISMQSISSSAQTVGAGELLNRGALTHSRMRYSRLIGALFLAGFLSYGVGFALVTSVVGTPDFLATISANKNLQTILILGAFLMVLNSLVDVGKGVLFFPILEPHGKRIALTYLATMIVEVVLLAVGVLALLMLVPIAQQGVDAGQAGVGWATALGALALQANGMAYQIAEMVLGLGAIFLCALLFRTQLIPRLLAGWGVLGYALLAAGAIAEIFGTHLGLVLSIPGGLFEVALGFWLLIKGFQPKAYGQES